jgi:hypothetical protein
MRAAAIAAEALPSPCSDVEASVPKRSGLNRPLPLIRVTNRRGPGDGVIWWLPERCGKSEEVHSALKSDLAGGQMPSGLFGASAAWWALAILAFNLNAAMKRLALGKDGPSRA